MSAKHWAAVVMSAVIAAGCYPYRKEPDFQSRLVPSRPSYGGQHEWPPYSAIYTQRFVWKMRYMAGRLAAGMPEGERARTPLLMTTIAPVDDIYRGTSFGRLVTETLMTELSAQGFRVIEARKMKGYRILDGEGEFYLSRDVMKIAAEHEAGAALVGTYSESGGQAIINTRIIDTRRGRVIAAATAMMDIRGDRFLGPILGEVGAESRDAETPEIATRGKVIPGEDHYADVLRSMARDMAHDVAEAASGGADRPPVIAVATFVDVDNMRRAATFGRYMTELLMESLSSMGCEVLELRAAPEVYIDLRIGELALTREMSQLIGGSGADAVVLGSYTKAGDKVMVSARMVMKRTKRVVGAGSMTVDAGEENEFVAALLKNEIAAVPPTETVEGF